MGASPAARRHKAEMARKKRQHLESKRQLETRARFREKEAKAATRKQVLINEQVKRQQDLEDAAISARMLAETRAKQERAEAEKRAQEAARAADEAEKAAQAALAAAPEPISPEDK